MDKAHLGWHRQTNPCPEYDRAKHGQLKIFPSIGHGGNKAARDVFAKYMMRVPNQMLYMPVRQGAKSVGSVGSARSSCNVGQYDNDTQNTDFIDLSAGEDDGPSTVRTPQGKKQKVCTSPTIADILATQQVMNSRTRVKVGQRVDTGHDKGNCNDASSLSQSSEEAFTPPKAPRHAGIKSGHANFISPSVGPSMDTSPMRHVPCALAVREHATYARTKARKAALEQSKVRFPDVDSSLEPVKLGLPPGLYTLVVQSGDIIPVDLMTNLLAPVKKIRNLHGAEKLARKVFGAWGALQCMPELTVSIFQ